MVIGFSPYAVGSSVYLHEVFSPIDRAGTLQGDPRSQPILRFDVVHQEADPSRLPDRFLPIAPLPVSATAPTREFIFTRDNGRWTINHQVWAADRIDANPQPGAIEIWKFINPDRGRLHPVHLHLVDAQLLDRNGAAPRPYERGWKDVFLLGEAETLRVAMRFHGGPNNIVGKFMMHCHQLIHEDNGMMSQFEVGQGGVDPVTTAPAKAL